MKTISVKQVATALDITPRAVIYRLEKSQLRGTQSPNAFGKQEWRVYPTKEIIEGLKRNSASVEQARKEAPDQAEFDFSPEDIEVIEADAVFEEVREPSSERSSEAPKEDSIEDFSAPNLGDWHAVAHEAMKSMAEELVRPLGEIIKQQQNQLASQQVELLQRERLIEDQNRQLRLLPDLEKQAEDERKAAELKELEAEALRKQIVAMQATQEQAAELRRIAEEEMHRLREEKQAQEKVVQDQLQALLATVQELQKPKPTWFQKWFLPREGQ